MICEIINPSDPYTLETQDFVAAVVGIAIVGAGRLGLSCDDPPMKSPVLFGWDQWLQEQGIEDFNQWVKEHADAIADALESVIIGNAHDRELVNDALKAIEDPAKREAFRAKHHDKKRSSMSDIGSACWKTAKTLRQRHGKIATAVPIVLVSK